MRRRSAPRTACGCRPEISGRAAARGGDDRLWPWGDELPDTTRATFGQGIGRALAGRAAPAGAAPCGALDLAGNVWEWTVDGAARGGSYLSGPDELACTAPVACAPPQRAIRTSAFRVVAVEPRGVSTGSSARRASTLTGRDPERDPAAACERGCVRARANARHERASTSGFVADDRRPQRPPHWPAAPDQHPSRSSTGTTRPRSRPAGGRLPTEAGVGEGGPRHRPAHLPVGRRGGRKPRRDRGRDQARLHVAGRLSHPKARSPYGLSTLAGNVSGMDVDRVPARRTLCSAAARSPAPDTAGPRRTMRESHGRSPAPLPHRLSGSARAALGRGLRRGLSG